MFSHNIGKTRDTGQYDEVPAELARREVQDRPKADAGQLTQDMRDGRDRSGLA